jgi:hypothetical protein
MRWLYEHVDLDLDVGTHTTKRSSAAFLGEGVAIARRGGAADASRLSCDFIELEQGQRISWPSERA